MILTSWKTLHIPQEASMEISPVFVSARYSCKRNGMMISVSMGSGHDELHGSDFDHCGWKGHPTVV